MRTLRPQTAVPAMLGVLVLLAGCTAADPEPSASPSASETVSDSPSPSASATPSASDASPHPVDSGDVNDPGDGVATDPDVTAPAAPTDGSRAEVEVVLTRAGVLGDALIAGGYIDGIVESGGVCTLTLTAGSQTATASGNATPSATSTDCGEGLSIPVSDLASGSWDAVVSYESDSYEGTSAPEQVTVP